MSIPYEIAPSVIVNKKGELGTFAVKDLPEDFDLGSAVEVPMGSTRPSVEWIRSELCKLTNHSSNPNVKQVSRRTRTGVIVHYVTNRPIKQGEELLANYKEFDFYQLIDMTFLDPTAGNYVLYHRIQNPMWKFHKEFGICSPERIVELKGKASGILDDFFDSPQFNFESFEKYRRWLERHPYLNSSTIFFSMFPLTDYDESYIEKCAPCIEFKIDTLKFDAFLPSIIAGKNGKRRFHNWDKLRTDEMYNEMRKLVKTPYSHITDRRDPVMIGVKDVFQVDLELCERTYRKYDRKGNFEDVPIR